MCGAGRGRGAVGRRERGWARDEGSAALLGTPEKVQTTLNNILKWWNICEFFTCYSWRSFWLLFYFQPVDAVVCFRGAVCNHCDACVFSENSYPFSLEFMSNLPTLIEELGCGGVALEGEGAA